MNLIQVYQKNFRFFKKFARPTMHAINKNKEA